MRFEAVLRASSVKRGGTWTTSDRASGVRIGPPSRAAFGGRTSGEKYGSVGARESAQLSDATVASAATTAATSGCGTNPMCRRRVETLKKCRE